MEVGMKRMFACLFITAVLPLMASTQNSSTNSHPFATVAYAGHNLSGNWCECGTEGCICDPGETSAKPASVPVGESENQGTPSAQTDQTAGVDFGSSAILLALAFFLWTRLRA
jgi:hypothetical protein